MSENIVEVGSVSEFIAAIEESNCKHWRGECMDFGETRLSASGFRAVCKDGDGKEYIKISSHNYRRENIKKFYRETASRLTQNEKDNFLAFAQHHGLGTSLLDITTNSLIALWMACEKKDKDDDEDGYVYGFNDNSDIQVDEFYASERFDFEFCDTDEQKDDFRQRCSWYVDKHYQEIILTFLDGYKSQTNDNLDKSQAEIMLWEVDLHKGERFREDHAIVLKSLLQEIKSGQKSFEEQMRSETFRKYFAEFFEIYYPDFLKEELTEETAALIPRMIYNPLMSFDRAEKQGSLFYYQYSPPNGDVVQKFTPDIIIKIKKDEKLKIIKTLDSLNINRGSVYVDFDSIAQYIKESQG